MFLSIEDYKPVCEPRELALLQQDDETSRHRAERVAMEEVASYLRTRYDMEKAYGAVGEERNAHLVQICVNVTLYYLVHWLPKNMASASRTALYEGAIEWLRSVQKGGASADLPEYDTLGTGAGSAPAYPMAMGSMKRSAYDW